jgi:hypothetical protein
VERVLTNIDADHGDCAVVGSLRHGVLLVFAAPSQLLSLAGRERGRAIPLTDIQPKLFAIFPRASISILIRSRHNFRRLAAKVTLVVWSGFVWQE